MMEGMEGYSTILTNTYIQMNLAHILEKRKYKYNSVMSIKKHIYKYIDIQTYKYKWRENIPHWIYTKACKNNHNSLKTR